MYPASTQFAPYFPVHELGRDNHLAKLIILAKIDY